MKNNFHAELKNVLNWVVIMVYNIKYKKKLSFLYYFKFQEKFNFCLNYYFQNK